MSNSLEKLQEAYEKIAYFAGLIDGEGSIFIKKYENTYQLMCEITMTDREVLEEMREYFGFGSFREMKKQKSHHKRCFRLSFTSEQAKTVIKTLYPYLRTKKHEAQVGIEFSRLIQKNTRKLSAKDLFLREMKYKELQALKRFEYESLKA